jgi:restriction system protein
MRDLHELSPKQFKDFCVELFGKLGLEAKSTEHVELTGVNIIAVKNGVDYFIQCRRPGTREVGLKAVGVFYAAMEEAGCLHGFLVSTGRFSAGAKEFVAGKPIELLDGAALIDHLKHLGLSPGAAPETESMGC